MLESKIQQHIGSGDDDSAEDFGQGLVTIIIGTFIMFKIILENIHNNGINF